MDKIKVKSKYTEAEIEKKTSKSGFTNYKVTPIA